VSKTQGLYQELEEGARMQMERMRSEGHSEMGDI